MVAESEGQTGGQAQSEVGPVALPGAITRIDQQMLILNRRMDDVLSLILPDPAEMEKIELEELRRENKELKISLYVVAGLFFLLFMAARR